MTGPVAPVGNDLGTIITSPRARTIIYGTYVVALLVLGAFTVGFASLGLGLPPWAVVANAVLGYLGIPVGGLAIVNVKKAA